jgi:hypothetical protein
MVEGLTLWDKKRWLRFVTFYPWRIESIIQRIFRTCWR